MNPASLCDAEGNIEKFLEASYARFNTTSRPN